MSKSLWGEACLVLGREEAAIAVAIVSAKPPGHVRSSPGGYFQGMVTKAQAGELNLARTIWGLRTRVKQVGESGTPRRVNGSQPGLRHEGSTRHQRLDDATE